MPIVSTPFPHRYDALPHFLWSSYRTNAHGEKNELIKPHFMYEGLGATEAERQASYRALFRYNLEPGLIDEIRKATNGNFVLGHDRFKEEISRALGRRVKPGKAGRPVKNEK